jgi:lipid-A-disaccharide synthase-like uncharacterized protein
MSELLLIYIAYSLAAGPTSLPVSATGFMPFQDNYWLWKAIGFAGIGVFGTRFIVQWVYSEKLKESKIPTIFWWQSLLGTFLCLAYFLRQQDSVGVAGYVLNVIPYSRNLILVYRKKRLERTENHDAGGPHPRAVAN